MKTKLLIAALACLALGACNQESGTKEEKKTVEQTTTQETGTPSAPSHTDPSNPGHSSIESDNQFAAADQTTTGSSMDQSLTNDANSMKNQGAGQSGYTTDSSTTTTTTPGTDTTTSTSGTTSPSTATGSR